MKKRITLIFLLPSLISAAQLNVNSEWTWMKGSNTTGEPGVYGTQGVASAANHPGARDYAVSWTDYAGNLWLFGGGGFNDLWKFDPLINQWTWMKGDSIPGLPGVYGTRGTPADGNKPGGRSFSVSWTDNDGNLWLFGGAGFNDLWKFKPSTNQWTWMNGDNTTNGAGVYGLQGIASSTNKPGARLGSVSWTDAAGNLWLFGGLPNSQNSSSLFNDLWKYNPSANQWTWVKGDSIPGMPGVYGTQGIADPANKPGARAFGVSWKDRSDNLWLFGGSSSALGLLNDLWKYDISTNQWTWMKGDHDNSFSPGVYGTQGIPAPGNKPGARTDRPAAWSDAYGNFWLFGGFGLGSGAPDFLNDLWKYDPASNQWTWVKGSGFGSGGGYGTQGIGAVGNIPGARLGNVSWSDKSGNLWLFGGYGIAVFESGFLNDLWKLSNPASSNAKLSNLVISQGVLAPAFAPGTISYKAIVANSVTSLTLTPTPEDATSAITVNNIPVNSGSASGAIALAVGSNTINTVVTAGDGTTTKTYTIIVTRAAPVPVDINSMWTWVQGDNIPSGAGDYGIKGTPSPTNKPGARYGCVSWTDGTGNLWLFGGRTSTIVGVLNDLWKYDPITSQWTWISGDNTAGQPGVYGTKGIPGPDNRPGGRIYPVSWIDGSGNLWLFGGSIAPGLYLNDLWKYTPSSKMWTWISGDNITNAPGIYGSQGTAAASNKPGARTESTAWTDTSGNIWLFGGYGYPGSSGGWLNDLWKYEPATNLWTWMKGDNIPNAIGVYGARGVAAAANNPPPRDGAVSWRDLSGNLWLFGGHDYLEEDFNDLWKYDPVTNQWTWVKGDNSQLGLPVYGIKGIPDAANTPGGRRYSAAWTEASGNLWLFGGSGVPATGVIGSLSDLWKYDPFANEWTWIKGDDTPLNAGIYGSQGTSAPGNKPGARFGCVSWTTGSGNLWLFGGWGVTGSASGVLNDLWKIPGVTPVNPNLTINDVTLNEGNSGTTVYSFTVSLSSPAGAAGVTFDIATADGTATTANNDYVSKSLTAQTVPPGSSTYTFNVLVNGDLAVEPNETFFVNVTNVSGANITDGQGLGTISNDDNPNLTINDVTLNEGNTGTTTFAFTVSLSAPAGGAGVTFDIATADGTATTANNDYVSKSLTAQTIPAGSSTYTFNVLVNGDLPVEPNETFFVNVTNITGANVIDAQGLGTITNDDISNPNLTINDVTLNEGNSGTTTFTFTVNLSAPAGAGGVTFDIATANGTATIANNDYASKSLTTQTIPAGSSTYTFNVLVNGDLAVEPNETFFVNITNVSGANVTDPQGLGTITNDDISNPNLTINDVTLNEGNSGTTTFTFTVSLSAPAGTGGVTFDIATADGTATTVNNDYVSKLLTTQTIPAGSSTYTFNVLVNGDVAVEPNETFFVNVTNVSGANITDGQALGTITNDDTLIPNLTINDVTLNEGNSGTTTFAFTVSLSAPAGAGGVTFDIATADGTATTSNNDYVSKSLTTQTIPAGSSTYTFNVLVNGDLAVEPNETFFVNVTNVTGANVTDAQGLGTVTNDDISNPNLTINDVTVNEGNSGTTTFAFTVSLSAPAGAGGVTFDIATADGTATTANNDYVSKSLTAQTIPAGSSTYTFNVVVNGDLAVEPNETFFVNVTNVTGANIIDAQGLGTITNDDASIPNLTINDVTNAEGNSGTTTFTFTVSLSSPAGSGGVAFSIATADGTATIANNDYISKSLTTQTISAGSSTYTFNVVVNGDLAVEPNETFFVNVTSVSGANVTDGQGLGTITNDDNCESAAHQAYVSNINTGNQAYRGELGMDFTVVNTNGIIVKQLGAFDHQGNGITGLQPGNGVRVAIWNKTSHTIVPGLDITISGNADPSANNHRMRDIPAVTLMPGSYVIVAKGYNSNELNGNSGIGGLTYPIGDNGSGAITFGGQSLWGPDDPVGFNYPTTSADLGTTHRFLAGTFSFTIPCQPPPPNSADLSNLALSQGTLVPSFARGTNGYNASVDYSVTSITVTPTAADPAATIKVNGVAVASGTASLPISLIEGLNTITTVVTSKDGIKTNPYTVTLTREGVKPPKIITFSPASGPVGTTVKITGESFNATPANNIVYFGAVRAIVNAGNNTSLTVTVPSGATYKPISVLNNSLGLTGYSAKPFLVTFTNPFGAGVPPDYYVPLPDIPAGIYPIQVVISDFDGDGKPDIADANFNPGGNFNTSTLSVFRNTSTCGASGPVSFAPVQVFPTGVNPYSLSVADIDGDGKPDMVNVNYTSQTVSVFRNTSTPGNISFAGALDFPLGFTGDFIATGDLDGDGKQDIAIAGTNGVFILRNTSTPGNINFVSGVFLTTGSLSRSLCIGDLDGDDKPDLILGDGVAAICVFRNISTSGNMGFASKIIFPVDGDPSSIAVGDMDGDGKPDLAVAKSQNGFNSIAVLRNISTSANINFATKVDLPTDSYSYAVAIGDVDGDGKVDLISTNFSSNTISVLRNLSALNNISFAPAAPFITGSSPYSAAIGDLNCDGIPETVVTNYLAHSIRIFKVTAPQGCVPHQAYTSNINTGNQAYVGSSRVDLQACKLEYSIVSPK